MPVNLRVAEAADLNPVAGVELGTVRAGIRKPDRRDLLVVRLAEGSRIAAIFTRNRFCAAPVIVGREHLIAASKAEVKAEDKTEVKSDARSASATDAALGARRGIRAIVVNTGCANAGTGAEGRRRARDVCAEAGRRLGIEPVQVIPMSTGVILEHLPVDRIAAGLDAAIADLSGDAAHWVHAAEAIMTTDTRPKARSRRVTVDAHTFNVTGIAKGAGMIRPNMATMLALIATDAPVSQSLLQQWVREAGDASFNRITVDGDTSTNDTLLLVATGAARLAEAGATDAPAEPAAGVATGAAAGPATHRAATGTAAGTAARTAADRAEIDDAGSPIARALYEAIASVALELAQAIVRDGEGATKFIAVQVDNASDGAQAAAVAYAIAHSPLVKTAFFASDPNLGRILAAIGYAGIEDLDVSSLDLYLGDVLVASNGGRHPDYVEADGQRVMQQAEITVRVDLRRGCACTTVWTCDLSHDYVSINADYRS